MRRLNRNLRRFFYVEPLGSEFIAWFARFVTIPFFGRRYTVIYGLDFEVFSDIKQAHECIKIQKKVYKIALLCR